MPVRSLSSECHPCPGEAACRRLRLVVLRRLLSRSVVAALLLIFTVQHLEAKSALSKPLRHKAAPSSPTPTSPTSSPLRLSCPHEITIRPWLFDPWQVSDESFTQRTGLHLLLSSVSSGWTSPRFCEDDGCLTHIGSPLALSARFVAWYVFVGRPGTPQAWNPVQALVIRFFSRNDALRYARRIADPSGGRITARRHNLPVEIWDDREKRRRVVVFEDFLIRANLQEQPQRGYSGVEVQTIVDALLKACSDPPQSDSR